MPEGKVLVVDDSEITLEVVRMSLEDEGFEVETLQSAFQLTAAIRRIRPDVILLDVRMPALGGDKVASILKERDFSKHIPTLLHSDMEEAELADMAARTGAAGYVKKSMDSGDLIREVRRSIERAYGSP